MEPSDREKIQKNLVNLSKKVNLSILSNELVKREIIDQDDVERIKRKFHTEAEQAQEFFLFYTKRGPDAYGILIEALRSTGYSNEAILLSQTSGTSSPCLSPTNGVEQNGVNGLVQENETGNDDIMISSITSIGSLPSPTSGAASFKISSKGVIPIDLSLSNFVFERPPLKINVRKATMYNNGKIDRVYQMMSRPRGFALLINNIHFPGDPKSTRRGAEKDSNNLCELLEALGFEVTIHNNVEKQALLDTENGIITKFIDQFKNHNVDACFVALMSHGTKNKLRMCDPMVPDNVGAYHIDIYEDILYNFNNRNCPSLMGKPKIFLIQACRGKIHDRGIRRTQTDGKKAQPAVMEDISGDEFDLPDRCPEMEDFLICNSTVHGYVSNRDTDRGSWYIECFCQVFMDLAHNTEILVMLKEVARMMRYIQSEYGEKQMCNFDNTGFFNDLYFNPSLYADPDGNNPGDSSASG